MRRILVAGAVLLEGIARGSAMAQRAAAPPPKAPTATLVALPAPETIERVTISAAKREQTLRDVPIPVSLTSAATLEKARIGLEEFLETKSVMGMAAR